MHEIAQYCLRFILLNTQARVLFLEPVREEATHYEHVTVRIRVRSCVLRHRFRTGISNWVWSQIPSELLLESGRIDDFPKPFILELLLPRWTHFLNKAVILHIYIGALVLGSDQIS